MADSTGVVSNAAKNPYLRDAVMTANAEQLQLMLYDGAIRYTLQARDAIQAKDYETSYEKLSRAQRIILEMRCGLNFDINRELCERVSGTYGFIYQKLVEANVKRDVNAIDDAMKILHIERETWQILVDKLAKERENGVDPLDEGRPVGERESTQGDPTPSFSVEG